MTSAVSGAPDAPLPHNEIAELIRAAGSGNPDVVRRARLLCQRLSVKIASNLLATVHERVLSSPYCGGGHA